MAVNFIGRGAAFTILIAYAGVTAAAEKPRINQLDQAVRQYFAQLPDYQPGDLIDRNQAAKLMKDLRARGWKLCATEALLQKIPTPDEFLVQQLRTAAGKKFMRNISKMPLGYDRLDRLAQLPQGQQTIRDLIRGPGGYKLIDYMTGASGGKQLGKMLSNSPQGRDFNGPTGKIYTATAFTQWLAQNNK